MHSRNVHSKFRDDGGEEINGAEERFRRFGEILGRAGQALSSFALVSFAEHLVVALFFLSMNVNFLELWIANIMGLLLRDPCLPRLGF